MGRHPWLFAGAIQAVEGEPADGDWVRVCRAEDGAFIAHGIYNSKSQIRVRLYSWNSEEDSNDLILTSRLNQAIDLRLTTLGLSLRDSFRVVYSEGDELSGLVVDKFGDYLSVQMSALAIHLRRDAILKILADRMNPKGIKIKADRLMGTHEGAEFETYWQGEEPKEAFEISDGHLTFLVDLRAGQKTGFYLDQTENRKAIQKFSRGKAVLDLYSYSGGFAMHAARGGASKVVGVDSSAAALQLARRNAQLNSIQNIDFVEADVFEFLKAQEEASFDLIVCDPPRFAGGRKETDLALRKYFRLNAEVLRVLRPGGILVSCSCSGSVSMPEFLDMLAGVGRKVGRAVQVLEKKGASSDHPVLASCPETDYLKVVVAKVGP